MSWEYMFPVINGHFARCDAAGNAPMRLLVRRLKPAQFAVAIQLADEMKHVGPRQGLVTISYGRLAKKSGMSRRTAIVATESLVELGLLSVLTRGGSRAGERKDANTFRAHWAPKVQSRTGSETAPVQESTSTGAGISARPVQNLHPIPLSDQLVQGKARGPRARPAKANSRRVWEEHERIAQAREAKS